MDSILNSIQLIQGTFLWKIIWRRLSDAKTFNIFAILLKFYKIVK